MKKALLLNISLAFITLFNAEAVKKMAYITDPAQATYANDTKILPMFQADSNFEVTVITATTAGQDLTGYDLIVIAEPAGSTAAIMASLKGINKPVLNMKVYVYKVNAASWSWSSTNADNPSQNVLVKKPNHPIFKGLGLTEGSTLQLTTSTVTKSISGVTEFLNVVGTLETLATIKDATTGLDAVAGQLCIMEFPVGASIAGTTIPQKFIQIGISGTSYALVTAEALTVIKNAAYYVADMNTGLNNVSQSLPVTQTSKELLVNTTENLDLDIYSVSGQLVKRANGNSILINEMNKGIYMLRMTNNKGLNQTYKFSK